MVALSPSVQLPVDSECFEADQVHEPEGGPMGVALRWQEQKQRSKRVEDEGEAPEGNQPSRF